MMFLIIGGAIALCVAFPLIPIAIVAFLIWAIISGFKEQPEKFEELKKDFKDTFK